MLVIPAFRVRICSAIMHVSLVCVINSFSLYLLYIYIYSLISLWLSIVSKEWEMKIISDYSFLDYFAKNHVRYCHHLDPLLLLLAFWFFSNSNCTWMIPCTIYFFDLVDMDRNSKYGHHHRAKTQMLLNTCLTSMTSTFVWCCYCRQSP